MDLSIIVRAEGTEEPVYSNLDHEIDKEVSDMLAKRPNELYSQHSAWSFCGYVWFDGEVWREEIWQWKSLVEVLSADSLEDLIEKANNSYGRD